MTKNEKAILLDSYKMIVSCETIGLDKDDARREFESLLDKLDLKTDRYLVKNNVICETNEYDLIVVDTFYMVFNTFLKYNRYVYFDINDIDDCYNDLQFEMNDEDIKCHNARMKILKEKLI